MHWSEKTAIKENVYQQYICPHKFNILILYGTLTDTNTWMHTHTYTQKETERDTQRSHIYTKANEKISKYNEQMLKKEV